MVVADGLDVSESLKHCLGVSTLAEIQKEAEKLSPQQKRELMLFLDVKLGAESNSQAPHNLPPAERAAELRRWSASHKDGPGLPDFAIGRDAIYD